MRSSYRLKHLTTNANVATALGSILTSFDTVDSACWKTDVNSWQFNEVYMGEKLYEDLQEKANTTRENYEYIRAKIVRQKSTKNG